MKINFSNKGLKEYFETRDRTFLKKVYDDAIQNPEKLKKPNKPELSKS